MGVTKTKVIEKSGVWGSFFFMAYIGAAIYFVSTSSGTFWGVVLGLLEAIVWPVFLIYHALRALGA